MIRDIRRYGKHSRAAFKRVLSPGLVLFMQNTDTEQPDGLFRCSRFDGHDVDYQYRNNDTGRIGHYRATWDWLAGLSWSLADESDWLLAILEAS